MRLNVHKWTEKVVFLPFCFGNLLRAKTACTVEHLNFHRGALRIFACKCRSCHNGVQFFISNLRRWLRTRRFNEPIYFSTLRSHKTLEKHSVSHFFYFFRAPASSFFWLFLFSDFLFSLLFSSLVFFLLFSSLLFSSLSLPASAFSAVHIVGSLTSNFLLIRTLFFFVSFRTFCGWKYVCHRTMVRKLHKMELFPSEAGHAE